MLNTQKISGDVFGGITAAIVALPLALAFGVQSGMGAIAGLYGAIGLGFFAALLGGTKTQISGPTGPMTVVSAVVVASEIEKYGSLSAAMGTIIAIFVLAGLFLVLMGLLRIGQYVRYMPYPVISGFMSGIGIIIILMQIFPFFGIHSPSHILGIFTHLSTISNTLNFEAVGLSLATISIIYLFPYLTTKIPSALVALIGLTLLSVSFNIEVPIIGDIPSGLPHIQLDTLFMFDWYHPMQIVIPALTLASLGAIDSLLTSVVADNMTKTQHDSNRELIGQGLGNIAGGLIGGLPGAGATMRTVVNIKAGGRTQLSGMIHSIILLVVLLGAGAYAKFIPLPVLAGILITVGIDIIDYKGIKHIACVPRSDAVVMLIVLLMTVFVDLLQAVAVGMMMASILFMKQMGDITESKAVSTLLDDFHDIHLKADEKNISDAIRHQIYIQHFDGPIFFGFTAHFKKMLQELPEISVVIFRMQNVPSIDQSGMYALEDAILELEKKEISVVIVGLQRQPKDMLQNIQLIPLLVPKENLFSTFNKAIKELEHCDLDLDLHAKKSIQSEILWRH